MYQLTQLMRVRRKTTKKKNRFKNITIIIFRLKRERHAKFNE